MTPLGQGVPSPATMLFSHPIRGIMPIINRPLVGVGNDKEHHEAIIKRQTKDDKNNDTSKKLQAWFIVYVITLIACTWLFLKLC